MKLILVQGCSIRSPLPSRTKIVAIRYHFHTELSREREPTFVRGAVGAYGEQQTMHHPRDWNSWEHKHLVCKLTAPSILII